MNYKEVEAKYDASNISISSFVDLIEQNFSIKKKMLISSHDDYFTDVNDNFIRYRYTDNGGELTIKRKLNSKNNNHRIEVNIPTSGDNVKSIAAFVDLLGYRHNFSIYKTCKIYWSDTAVFAYYVVYDREMQELRRFLEIEANESHTWASEEEAWNEVIKCEKTLEPLGITSKNRLKKSLFELFKQNC
jgi:adenylate cyclase class IV